MSTLKVNFTLQFDKNLKLLDDSNSLAYQTQSQFATNSTIVQAQRTNCISAAVSSLKVKSIETANDYDACLQKLAYQRDQVVPQQQQQQLKELPEQKPEQRPVQRPEQKPEQKPEERPEQPQQPIA